MNDLQSEKVLKPLKVVIPVQEFVTFLDAKRGNHAVYRFSYRDPAPLQRPEVLRGGNGNLARSALKNRQRTQLLFGCLEMVVGANAAQNFAKN